MRVCTRPVSVMAKHAIPDTEKKSGRVQLSKDHAERHVDVSTIKMYKLLRPVPVLRRAKLLAGQNYQYYEGRSYLSKGLKCTPMAAEA